MTAHQRVVPPGSGPLPGGVMRIQETTRVALTGDEERGRALRFREAALPHLGDVYTLARYLLRNPADAEDAAQECYLRAYRHFDTFRGGPIKPWLLAILRNVCRAEYARRGTLAAVQADSMDDATDTASENLWGEASPSPARHRPNSPPASWRSRIVLIAFCTRSATARSCGTRPSSAGSL